MNPMLRRTFVAFTLAATCSISSAWAQDSGRVRGTVVGMDGQSTTHAEYMARTDAANQAAWYRSFFSEIGYDVEDLIPLHGDNKEIGRAHV